MANTIKKRFEVKLPIISENGINEIMKFRQNFSIYFLFGIIFYFLKIALKIIK